MIDSVYSSLIDYCRNFAPSGIPVVSGESYGVRFIDPGGKVPSLSIQMETTTDVNLELGSGGAYHMCSVTTYALSRFQRDALKSLLFDNIPNASIPIYANIDAGDTTLVQYASVLPGVRSQDMPNWNSNSESYYWINVLFFSLEILT